MLEKGPWCTAAGHITGAGTLRGQSPGRHSDSPLEGSLCRYDVQRRSACGKHSGHRESHSGLRRKPFAFPSESLFAFSPESRSPSPRNAFHVHPGIVFAFLRNPHTSPSPSKDSPRPFSTYSLKCSEKRAFWPSLIASTSLA